MNQILIYGCGFLAVVLGINGLHNLATQNQRNIQARLERIAGSPLKQKADGEDNNERVSRRKDLLRKTGGLLFRKSMTKQIEEQLAKAAIPLRGEEFLVIWLLMALLPLSVVFLITGNLLLVMAVYTAGILLPPYLVIRAQKNRTKKLNQQIFDALSIMSNALRAGFSFMQAMEMVSREMPDPISIEFARTYREINLGIPTEEALQKMVKRTASDDLDLLVTAVLIQRQVGGNLAEILDNISHTVRERIRIKGEIKTLTAQGRISGIIIGLIPPCLILLLLLINPRYLDPLLHTRLGWVLLASGVLTELIGLLLIKKIISIDY